MAENKSVSRLKKHKRLSRNLLILIMEDLMADMNALQAKIDELSTGLNGLGAKQVELQTEMINAFNRLEAKIAAGVDTQPAIDSLAPLSQEISARSTEIDSAIAQAKVSGV